MSRCVTFPLEEESYGIDVMQTLSALGVDFTLARDGREVLNCGETPGEPVEMVISAIEMPEMDGYTLTG